MIGDWKCFAVMIQMLCVMVMEGASV